MGGEQLSPKEVIISPRAEKEIKKLCKQDQVVALRALEKLEAGGGGLSIEKIKSQPNFYRLKAAHLRLIYYPLKAGRVVILVVRDRKDAYRALQALNDRLQKYVTSQPNEQRSSSSSGGPP